MPLNAYPNSACYDIMVAPGVLPILFKKFVKNSIVSFILWYSTVLSNNDAVAFVKPLIEVLLTIR